jgi:hypothetical protein
VSILFGAEPSLSAPHRLYERLLASDPAGARQVLRAAVSGGSADAAVDAVLVPALTLAAADRRREVIGAERLGEVAETARLIADELDEGPPPKDAAPNGAGRVLVAPAAGPADGVLADLFAARLQRIGVPADSVPTATLSGELGVRVGREAPAVLVFVGLPPLGGPWARYLAKRLRGRLAGVTTVAVLWPEVPPPAPPVTSQAGRAGVPQADPDLGGLVDHVSQRFADALERVRLLAERRAADSADPRPVAASA